MTLASILAQPEAQPPLRWALFALVGIAGWMWTRRRFRLSAATFLLAQGLAISFWSVQLSAPIGLDGSTEVQELWARVGVAHESGDLRSGYVKGTSGEASILTGLAASGASPVFLQGAAAWAPLLLLLTLAFACGAVEGSTPRRALTAALVGTSAPLWGLASDATSLALAQPERALASVLALLTLSTLTRVLRLPRSPLALAAMLFGALGAGAALSSGSRHASVGSWLRTGGPPLIALFFIPWIRRVSLAVASSRIKRTTVEAVFLVFTAGGSAWFWWEPARTLTGFAEARSGSPALFESLDWMKAHTPPHATIASTPAYAALIAARTGRAMLLPVESDAPVLDQPLRRRRLIESLLRGEPDDALVQRFGVTHLFLGPGEADPPAFGPGAQGSAERRITLRRVYADTRDFRVFEVVPP
jgi:hypothetical protein